MKKRGTEKSKKETSNSGEKLKGRRDSYHQGEKKKSKKAYSGDVCWHSKRLLGDQRGTQWTAYARQDKARNVHVVCVTVLCCPSLSLVSSAVEGVWVLEGGVWSMDLGRGQLLAAERQPEGKE